MISHDSLYYIAGKKIFFKMQAGTGDNLLDEDRAEGYEDYVLWSAFQAEDLGIDGELPMECIDSGMVLLTADERGLGDTEILERCMGEFALLAGMTGADAILLV